MILNYLGIISSSALAVDAVVAKPLTKASGARLLDDVNLGLALSPILLCPHQILATFRVLLTLLINSSRYFLARWCCWNLKGGQQGKLAIPDASVNRTPPLRFLQSGISW